jgi:hypothetical protein
MFDREEFAAHYHKRSNVETAFSAIKGKFGSHVRAKSDEGQVNEVLAKVLCHNVCVLARAAEELGVEPLFGSNEVFGSETPLEPALHQKSLLHLKSAFCTKTPSVRKPAESRPAPKVGVD